MGAAEDHLSHVGSGMRMSSSTFESTSTVATIKRPGLVP